MLNFHDSGGEFDKGVGNSGGSETSRSYIYIFSLSYSSISLEA